MATTEQRKPTDTQYTSNEKMLTLTIIGKDMDYIMRNPQEVYNTLQKFEKKGKKYSAPTIKNYLAFILSYMRRNRAIDDAEFTTSYHTYKSLHSKMSEKISNTLAKGEPSERQKNSVIDWNDAIKARDELGKKEYGSRKHLLLSIYTYIPPVRQDYGKVRILSKAPKKSEKCNGNYIILNTSTQRIILNEYKTGERYGYNEYDLPKELTKIIKTSLKQTPRQYLFTLLDDPTKPYEDDRSFTYFSNITLKEVLNNKGACVTMMRHAFDTQLSLNYAFMSLGDKEKIAKFMGHSICQQVKYMHVVKQDDDNAVAQLRDLHGVTEVDDNEEVESLDELKKKHDEEVARILEEKNKEYEEKLKKLKGKKQE